MESHCFKVGEPSELFRGEKFQISKLWNSKLKKLEMRAGWGGRGGVGVVYEGPSLVMPAIEYIITVW